MENFLVFYDFSKMWRIQTKVEKEVRNEFPVDKVSLQRYLKKEEEEEGFLLTVSAASGHFYVCALAAVSMDALFVLSYIRTIPERVK